jgi:hypothetical protein
MRGLMTWVRKHTFMMADITAATPDNPDSDGDTGQEEEREQKV